MVLLGAFGGLSMTEYGQNLGEEQKNGQNTTHYKVDVSSLPNFAQLGMPGSATVETWVADDGYLVSFLASDFGTVGAEPRDRRDQRQRSRERGGAPELSPASVVVVGGGIVGTADRVLLRPRRA